MKLLCITKFITIFQEKLSINNISSGAIFFVFQDTTHILWFFLFSKMTTLPDVDLVASSWFPKLASAYTLTQRSEKSPNLTNLKHVLPSFAFLMILIILLTVLTVPFDTSVERRFTSKERSGLVNKLNQSRAPILPLTAFFSLSDNSRSSSPSTFSICSSSSV